MAFTHQQLAAVEEALAKGERVVQYQDRRVEYRSVAELSQLRDTILAELKQQAGQGGIRLVRLFHAGKGI